MTERAFLPPQKPETHTAPLPPHHVKLERFVKEQGSGIRTFQPEPMFHGGPETGMPLGMRYISEVTHPLTGETVYFDIITKGVELPPLTPTPEPKDRRTTPTIPHVHIFTQPETDQMFEATTRQLWQNATLSKEPGIVLSLRTTLRLTSDPKDLFLPQDLPSPEVIKDCINQLSDGYHLDLSKATVASLHVPTRETLSEDRQIGQFTIHPERQIATPWGPDPLFLTSVTVQQDDGTKDRIELLSGQSLSGRFAGELHDDPLHVGIERACMCMRGRHGDDCAQQMEYRITNAVVANKGVLALLPTQSSMGNGEVWGGIEHQLRAEYDGVLQTGELPKTSNITARENMLRHDYQTEYGLSNIQSEDLPKDLTDYKSVGELLGILSSNFILYTENKRKVSCLTPHGTVETRNVDVISQNEDLAHLREDYLKGKESTGFYTHSGRRTSAVTA